MMLRFLNAALPLALALAIAACSNVRLAPYGGEGPAPGDIRWSCGPPPGFAPGLLDQPARAETEIHPSAAALRSALAGDGPGSDLVPKSYWLLSRDEKIAEYFARGPGGGEGDWWSLTIQNQHGDWKLAGVGPCQLRGVLGELSQARWILDPDLPRPGAEATTFTALVTEMTCTGGQAMGPRLMPPSVVYGKDSVLVVFAARPLGGDGAFDCPSNPSTRVVVELREPLGDRHLLDAGVFPPAEPVAPES
jgi:hypothetical protein